MKKQKELICCRCNLEINQKEDRWVNIRDFDCGKNVGDKSMHLMCWKNMAKETMQNALNEKAKQISPILKNLLGGLIQKNENPV